MQTPIVDRTRHANAARRKAQPGASDGALFALHLEGAAAAETDAPAAAAAPAALDALLGVQEVDGDAEKGRRRAAVQYGSDLLDQLERLRIDVLAGGVPTDRLTALARALRADRRLSQDPRLDAVIEEIELRAEVEIAKLARRR